MLTYEDVQYGFPPYSIKILEWNRISILYNKLFQESADNRITHFTEESQKQISELDISMRSKLLNIVVRTETEDFCTLFHRALSNGHMKKMQFLVKNGFRVENNNFTMPLLLRAVELSDREAVIYLVVCVGVQPNCFNYYHTPLSKACEMGNKDIVDILLNHGASVFVKPPALSSYLLHAKHFPDILESLARHGINLNEDLHLCQHLARPFTHNEIIIRHDLEKFVRLVSLGLDPFMYARGFKEDGTTLLAIVGDYAKVMWIVDNLYCSPSYKVRVLELLVATFLYTDNRDLLAITWKKALTIRNSGIVPHLPCENEPRSLTDIDSFVSQASRSIRLNLGLDIMKRYYDNHDYRVSEYIAMNDFPSYLQFKNLKAALLNAKLIPKKKGIFTLDSLFYFLYSHGNICKLSTERLTERISDDGDLAKSDITMVCAILRNWCFIALELQNAFMSGTENESMLGFLQNHFQKKLRYIRNVSEDLKNAFSLVAHVIVTHWTDFSDKHQRDIKQCFRMVFNKHLFFLKRPLWTNPVEFRDIDEGEMSENTMELFLSVNYIDWNAVAALYNVNPLYEAVMKGNVKIINMMLAKGIDKNIKIGGDPVIALKRNRSLFSTEDYTRLVNVFSAVPPLQCLAARVCDLNDEALQQPFRSIVKLYRDKN